ncbi:MULTISPECIES: MurR/RpiR family transcriptional regulator [Lacticaseibacillus]|uniref:RpiR family transcriptional regulator n=2 Tax=Lacticaseibacillus TaxID=2759736 RepID=A0AAN1F0R5_LACCA|nr:MULTISPECIES: MurR/RpiR family transcriptional regulator [Lacticaseibacillus]ARY92698.1 RpiR family transcriptional regulator [Lacticaseibacillus casei]KAB1969461.1 MurR/RpiR family transcriptional regulator [Lacticaseibacillus casei]WLV80599.1 MurR/RpiR family transcriptional regulator [Lacticaseibacillus sp. NCIMB 15473]WNX24559.1 MurR/RpiR family transcriptional regulator [Lacticaseibacillus casei]WNX27331.1 MurR/RpiR family transcriptional regulator [Lacticaseibacillus casei]
MKLEKLVASKHLSETELTVLQYMIANIDRVLDMGVREVAKANYTSATTVMRLAHKMGYRGFIELQYKLMTMLRNGETGIQATHDSQDPLISEATKKNNIIKFQTVAQQIASVDNKCLYVYAAGFSSVIGNYMFKKFQILGKRCFFSTPGDSAALLENCLEDLGLFIVVSKSGETQTVIDKATLVSSLLVPIVAFTGKDDSSLAKIANWAIAVPDEFPLDDLNQRASLFYPRMLTAFELVISEVEKLA